LTGYLTPIGSWILPHADPANSVIRLRGNSQVQNPEVGGITSVSTHGVVPNSELNLPPVPQKIKSILLNKAAVSDPLPVAENKASQQGLNSLEGSKASTSSNSATTPENSGLSNTNGEVSGGILSELLDKFS
jgi:hypothetical protein